MACTAAGSRSFPVHFFAARASFAVRPLSLRALPLCGGVAGRGGSTGSGSSSGRYPGGRGELSRLPALSFPPRRWYSLQQSEQPKSAEAANQEIALLNSHVADCYRRGLFGDALPHAKRAQQLCMERFGRAHPSYASACNNQALLHRSLQDAERAKTLYEEALWAYGRSVGTEHPSYATAAVNLAMCLRDTPQEDGHWPRALELLGQALEVRKSKLGEADSSLGQTLSAIGSLQAAMGNLEDALKCQLEGLKVCKKRWGDEHPQTGTAFNNLGYIYKLRKEYDQSEEYYLQAHGVRSRVLPGDGTHPDQIITLHNLVSLYSENGDKNKEERMSALLLNALQKVEERKASQGQEGE